MNCSKGTNENFNIPFHIFDEIVEYVRRGKPTSRWTNIYTLIKMAECNNRLTSSQATYLIENYK